MTISLIITVLFVVVEHAINHDTEFCGVVTNTSLCNYTFGCFWNGTACTEQEYYVEDAGTCEGTGITFPDEFGYICYDNGTNYYIYDPSYYDACSGNDYVTGVCPEVLDSTIRCLIHTEGCFELDCSNPWNEGCYSDTANAGICEGRSTYGCSAIPFCDWSSSCQPDWKCYYTKLNTGTCNADCKSKQVGRNTYCTSDIITSSDEKCILAGDDEDTCVAAGCEWIEPGSTTTAGPYIGWCTEIGSRASIAHMSSAVLVAILSVMLAFL